MSPARPQPFGRAMVLDAVPGRWLVAALVSSRRAAMAVYTIKRYVRPIEEVREHIFGRQRSRGNPSGNPFEHTDVELVRKALDSLTSLDRDEWAAAFMELAHPYEETAGYAEAAGDHGA